MTIDYLHTADSYSPKICSVVGIIGVANLKMERHGDFDPAIDDSMENARLTLSLVAPDIPGLDSDFHTFYNRIRILVDLLNPLANLHPLVTRRKDTNDIVLNFSHKLFHVSATCLPCA